MKVSRPAIFFAATCLLATGGCDFFDDLLLGPDPPPRYDLSVMIPGDTAYEGRPLYVHLSAASTGSVGVAEYSVPAAGSQGQVRWDGVLDPSRSYDVYWWIDAEGTEAGVCNAPDDPHWHRSLGSPGSQDLTITVSFDPTTATGSCAGVE